MMKNIFRSLFATAAALLLLAACKDDKHEGSLSFVEPACFLLPGTVEVVSFRVSHASDIALSTKPDGWEDPIVDEAARTVTIIAPRTFDNSTVSSGHIVIKASGDDGISLSAKLFVSAVEPVDLTSVRANSYLIDKGDRPYLIDVTRCGENGPQIAPASVKVIWQNSANFIQYLAFDANAGKASFYLSADAGNEERINPGNALIGAYDTHDNLLWSWHIWGANYDPDAEDGTLALGDDEMMTRNLGALDNSTETAESKLRSYGLYYQWGRKDPFAGPSAYTAPSGTASALYDGNGNRIYLTIEATDSERGTDAYATQHPMHFLTSTEEHGYDWLALHDPSRWSTTTKTDNDPCPHGWQVASQAPFEGLAPDAASAEWERDAYGAILTREGVSGLFMGAGRRDYRFGKVQNIHFPDAAPLSTRAEEEGGQPWVGLYWTSLSLSDNNSAALYFHYGAPAGEQVENQHPMRRANGLPVRCVRVK